MAKPEHIKDLVGDPTNRRAHNPRNLGMLVDALQKVGASRSIVIDEEGRILAGNGVVEAASEAGLTKLQIVDVDGQTVVAVRRSGLTEAQKRDLAIYDNRTGELAEWNLQQLAADLKNGEDLSAFFYDAELARLGLLGTAVDDPQAEWAGMPAFDQPAQSAFHSVVVHFKDAADMEDFAQRVGQPMTKTVRYLWHPEQPRAVFKNQRYE
jgi:hypothetical protein